MSHPARTEEEITTILFALAAWAGNANAASRWLKSEKGISVSVTTLTAWKRTHGAQYDEIREKHAGQLEGNLANEMREVARLALDGERLAVMSTIARLKKGDDPDPARSAANLARVAQSSTDKLLSLTGRPSQIIENRDIGALLRSLAAKGVLELPEGEVEEHGDARE